MCPGVLHAPNSYLINSRRYFRVWVLLRFNLLSNSRRSSGSETPTREFNLSSAIWLHSSLFLLVFFDSQARISLLGEVDRVTPVDNLRRHCAVIAGFGTCRSEAGSNCVATPPNRVILYHTKDRDPISYQVVSVIRLIVRYYRVPFRLIGYWVPIFREVEDNSIWRSRHTIRSGFRTTRPM